MKPIIERLMEKVEVSDDGCWIFTGSKLPYGYGIISLGGRGRGVTTAHRVAYECAVGPIPDCYEIDHLCETKSCVNPAHLEAVPHAENMRRRIDRSTACRRGHAWTEENTRWWNGFRRCRACHRENSRNYYRERKFANG